MPHLTIEYSRNLEAKLDMGRFCQAMRDAILATGLFEVGAVRVRSFASDHYAIADLHPENAFLDMSLRMGEGRDFDSRKRAGNSIFAVANDYLKDILETPHFALSLEIREISKALSWKNNAIHPRLRGK